MRVKLDLQVSPQQVMLLLILFEATLLMISSLIYQEIISTPKEIRKLFDLTLEGNIPTWLSVIQLISISCVAYIISCYHWQKKAKVNTTVWIIIALFFLYMSVDDASRMHERLATAIANAMEDMQDNTSMFDRILAFPSYYWQILFLPFFGAMGLFMLFTVFTQFSDNTLKLLFFAGIGCYVLAVLLDFADGQRAYDTVIDNTSLTLRQARHLSRSIEEFIEMLGTTCILIAFIYHYHELKSR